MAKVQVMVDEQSAADIHGMIVAMRSHLPDDDEMHPRLRDAEMALAGALRSVGWEPKPGGGWYNRAMAPRIGRPLGIVDLFNNLPPEPIVDNLWYWCRLHERTEQWVDVTKNFCVRVGPFMTQQEANRLADDEYSAPLGMFVEG